MGSPPTRLAGLVIPHCQPPFSPPSVVQMHPVVKVCLDEAAAGDLIRAGYYRWVYNHKPAWQTY